MPKTLCLKSLSQSIAIALSFALVLAVVTGLIANDRPVHIASDLDRPTPGLSDQGML